MSITERDRRILFLEARREENDAGEEEVTGWDALFYRWAAYEPVSDGERLRAAAVEQRSDARFRVLWSGPMVQITRRASAAGLRAQIGKSPGLKPARL